MSTDYRARRAARTLARLNKASELQRGTYCQRRARQLAGWARYLDKLCDAAMKHGDYTSAVMWKLQKP